MRKRSKYRPRPVMLPLTVGLSDSSARELMIIPHQSLEMIITGKGTRQHWHNVAARINYGATWQERFNDAAEPFKLAMLAMDASLERFERTGRMAFTGDEYRATAYALTLCDEMQQSMTRRELYQDMKTVFKEYEHATKAH